MVTPTWHVHYELQILIIIWQLVRFVELSSWPFPDQIIIFLIVYKAVWMFEGTVNYYQFYNYSNKWRLVMHLHGLPNHIYFSKEHIKKNKCLAYMLVKLGPNIYFKHMFCLINCWGFSFVNGPESILIPILKFLVFENQLWIRNASENSKISDIVLN